MARAKGTVWTRACERESGLLGDRVEGMVHGLHGCKTVPRVWTAARRARAVPVLDGEDHATCLSSVLVSEHWSIFMRPASPFAPPPALALPAPGSTLLPGQCYSTCGCSQRRYSRTNERSESLLSNLQHHYWLCSVLLAPLSFELTAINSSSFVCASTACS